MLLHPWSEITQLLRVMEAMTTPPGQRVIDAQQTTQHPRAGKAATVMRHQETHRLHQPRRFVEQALAFANRIAGQAPLALGNVTQAAMDHFRGTAGSAPGEIALFQQQATPATARGFAQNAGAADAAANDNQVPGFIRQRRQHVLPPRRVPVETHGRHSCNSVPGFSRPAGSKCRLSACKVSIASAPFSRSKYGAWSLPTPCW